MELHIVYSPTYNVPMLLLQGYGPDGTPWQLDAVHAHLSAARERATDVLPADAVTQVCAT